MRSLHLLRQFVSISVLYSLPLSISIPCSSVAARTSGKSKTNYVYNGLGIVSLTDYVVIILL